MPIPSEFSFPAYLRAKESVDDRALNRSVWQTLETLLAQLDLQALYPEQSTPMLQVLEVGSGAGSMIKRMLQHSHLGRVAYTALDNNASMPLIASMNVVAAGLQQGYHVHVPPEAPNLFLHNGEQKIQINFECQDIHDFIMDNQGRRQWDLLVANAFLDLFELGEFLPRLMRLLRPGGAFYFTINFDGATIFEPPLDPPLDAHIERLYHQTMDQRRIEERPSGDSQAGRHLFQHIRAAGGQILAAGPSDWVVFAGPDGSYAHQEAYFLHHILHFIETALSEQAQLAPEQLRAWIARRREQIERGELVYIAHQLDFCGVWHG